MSIQKSEWEILAKKFTYAKGQYPVVYFETPDVDFMNFIIQQYLNSHFIPLTDYKGLLSEEKIQQMNNENGIYYIENYDLFSESVGQEQALLATQVIVKSIARHQARTNEEQESNHILVLSGRHYTVPEGFAPYVQRLDVPYPDLPVILCIMKQMKFITDLTIPEEKLFWHEKADALRGLTIRQIRYILSAIRIKHFHAGKFEESKWPSSKKAIDDLLLELISELKEQIIRDNKAVKFIKPKKAPVGGCEAVVKYIEDTQALFGDKTYDLVTVPKGLLFAGVPGTGKSLVARRLAYEFRLNLLQLDMGSLMGKYVGESERRLRDALKLAEAVSPVVLWIDEMDKSIGNKSDGHEASQRMYAYLLNWMQECKKPVFIYATGNHIEKFDGALLRAGRFDAKFFSFMPSYDACSEIFDARIKKREESQKMPFFFDKHRNDKDLKSHLKTTKEQVFLEAAKEKKFLTGSDIENWIRMTINSLHIKGIHIPYEVDTFMKEMQAHLTKLSPYGQTSMIEIADYFLTAKYSGLTPAGTPIYGAACFCLENKSPDSRQKREQYRTMLEKSWQGAKDDEIRNTKDINDAFDLWKEGWEEIDRQLRSSELPKENYFGTDANLSWEYEYDKRFYAALTEQLESFSYDYITKKFVEKN